MHYDYLIVGTGLFGAVFAHEMKKAGKSCLMIDKRGHIGGNIYTYEEAGIDVHKYGAHIFHTSNKEVWDYVNRFVTMNHYINSPIAYYKGEVYNLPFNMNTFSKMWGVVTPQEAKEKIAEQIADTDIQNPKNLEEQALSMVGRDIFEKLVKGYTEKQWGRDCKELPSFIIKRLPLRFTYDNNYFNDPFQGIPKEGYTALIERLVEDTPVVLNCSYADCVKDHTLDFSECVSSIYNRTTMEELDGSSFGKTVYTGQIDEFFGYQLGHLAWRSLVFETKLLPDVESFQGNAVVNYTERDVPYTRIIEHKHFNFGTQKDTVITKEYPLEWREGDEPYYPVNDAENNALFEEYKKLASERKDVLFGGRLGNYRYYDMDKTIEASLELVRKELEEQS